MQLLGDAMISVALEAKVQSCGLSLPLLDNARRRVRSLGPLQHCALVAGAEFLLWHFRFLRAPNVGPLLDCEAAQLFVVSWPHEYTHSLAQWRIQSQAGKIENREPARCASSSITTS